MPTPRHVQDRLANVKPLGVRRALHARVLLMGAVICKPVYPGIYGCMYPGPGRVRW